jgi:hypothetical protein
MTMLNKILKEDFVPNKETEDVVLEPLMEEIDTIGHDPIRAFVRSILLAAPEWFWKAPSSFEEDGVFQDEAGEGGLLVYLKRTMKVFDLLAVSSNLTPEERDIGKAAILIGQMDKYNEDAEKNLTYNIWNAFSVCTKIDKIVEFNALWGKDGISNTLAISGEQIDQIKRVIRVQDGKWTTPPEVRPRNTLELMYHQALYIASSLKWLVERDDLGLD